MAGLDQNGNFVLDDGRVIPGDIAAQIGFVGPQTAPPAPALQAPDPAQTEFTQAPPAAPPPVYDVEVGQPVVTKLAGATPEPTAAPQPTQVLTQNPEPELIGMAPEASPVPGMPVAPQPEVDAISGGALPGQGEGSLPVTDPAELEAREVAARVDPGTNQVLVYRNEKEALQHGENSAYLKKQAGDEADAETVSALARRDFETQKRAQFLHDQMEKEKKLVQQADQKKEDLRRWMDENPLQPGKGWRDASVFKKALAFISVAFGALAQFSTGRNVGLETIHSFIEQDLEQQKSLRGDKRQALLDVDTQLGRVRAQFETEDAADAAERAVKLKSIEDVLQIELQKARGTEREAVLERDLYELRLQRGQLIQVAGDRWMAYQQAKSNAENARLTAMGRVLGGGKGKGLGGGGGRKGKGTLVLSNGSYGAPSGSFVGDDGETPQNLDLTGLDATDTRNVKERIQAGQNVLDAIATIRYLGTHRNLIPDAIKSGAAAMAAKMILDAQAQIKGVPSDKDMETLMKSIGVADPQKFLTLLDSEENLQLLAQHAHGTVAKINNELRSYRGPGYGKGIQWHKPEGNIIPGVDVNPQGPPSSREVEEATRRGDTKTIDAKIKGDPEKKVPALAEYPKAARVKEAQKLRNNINDAIIDVGSKLDTMGESLGVTPLGFAGKRPMNPATIGRYIAFGRAIERKLGDAKRFDEADQVKQWIDTLGRLNQQRRQAADAEEGKKKDNRSRWDKVADGLDAVFGAPPWQR